jgi:hypothetical protein
MHKYSQDFFEKEIIIAILIESSFLTEELNHEKTNASRNRRKIEK